jgi:hypothetical protein
MAVLLAGCTSYIPVKDSFGTSALRQAGKTPPEYAAFNNYNPGVNGLVASQMCATPYALLQQQTHPAVPGELITWRGACQPYVLTIYNFAEYLLPSRPLIAWPRPVAWQRPPSPPPPFPAPRPFPAAPPTPTPLLTPAPPPG